MATTLADYPAPFNLESADVTLVSSDGIHFRCHMLVLSLASPFFHDMFSLPQAPSNPSKATDMIDGLPTITLEEDGGTLYLLLQLCFPAAPRPDGAPFGDGVSLLRAGDKYCIPEAKRIGWELAIKKVAPTQPLRLFAIACQLGMIEEARYMARLSLAKDELEPLSPELAFINGADYHRLLEYRKRCCDAASTVVKNWDWSGLPPSMNHASNGLKGSWCATTRKDASFGLAKNIPTWLSKYMDKVLGALCKTPVAAVLYADGIFEEAMVSAIQCGSCQTGLMTFKSLFPNNLEHQISDAVKQVSERIGTRII
jgi:hypothetical protein